MFLVYLFNFIRGFVIIKVEGPFLERFINICTNRNIYIWDVSYKGSQCLIARTSRNGFTLLDEVSTKTHSKVEIVAKKGLPFFLFHIKIRKAFLSGFLIFIFLIVWLCSHIWAIEVPNTYLIEKNKIVSDLTKLGVKTGTASYKIDPVKIQRDMLTINPELSWFWINIKGTKVYVELKERSPKPVIIPSNEPCNIIASKSGIIKRMIVCEGVTLVQEGVSVAEGQLLVSGIWSSKVMGARYVRADAEITAETNQTISGSYSLIGEKRVETGKRKTHRSIEVLGKSFNLFWNKNLYENYDLTTNTKQLKVLSDIFLPFFITTTVYKEIKLEPETYVKDTIVEDAKNYLTQILQSKINNGKIVNKQFTVTDASENIVEVALNAICEEEIAKAVKIER